MSKDNANKENILIVHNYYQIPGGEDTVVANEKKMLEKHGHKVTLYSRDNAELKKMPRLRKIFLPITTVFNPRTYRDMILRWLIKQWRCWNHRQSIRESSISTLTFRLFLLR